MSNFVVSARKYRPNRFDDVVGQAHVSQTLKNALQNDHLAHAFLFCGPRGVGKTTCARILAKVLNCQNITEDHEPCNTCDSCVSFNGNASFNITELDAASNNSVEHIRALIEQVRFQPQQGKYKIFIIDEVHMLSQQAFNAFLKTLEEPPSYAIFILATTEKHKIIPTILSRCQIFDFRRIQVQDTVAHLQEICKQEGIQADQDALHIIAQKADGALRDALSIFDRIVSFSGKAINYNDVITNLNILDYDYYFKIVDALLSSDVSTVLLTFNDILRKGFEPDIFINGLAEHLRNLLVCKNQKTLELLEVSQSLQQRYHQQATLAPSSFILTALSLANDCDINYKMARNKRLHTEMAIIKMAHIAQAVELSQQAAPVAALEKKNPDLSNNIVKPIAKPTTANTKVEEPAPTPMAKAPKVVAETPTPTPPPAQTPMPPAPKKGLLGSDKKLTKSFSLDAIEQEIQQESHQEEQADNAVISLEQVQEAWNKYTETVTSKLIKNTLRNTELTINQTDDGLAIIATVDSTRAEEHLRKETELMDYLRENLKTRRILPKIVLDEVKAAAKKQQAPKKTILTPKDKFRNMQTQNPLVKKLYERFDLKLNED